MLTYLVYVSISLFIVFLQILSISQFDSWLPFENLVYMSISFMIVFYKSWLHSHIIVFLQMLFISQLHSGCFLQILFISPFHWWVYFYKCCFNLIHDYFFTNAVYIWIWLIDFFLKKYLYQNVISHIVTPTNISVFGSILLWNL